MSIHVSENEIRPVSRNSARLSPAPSIVRPIDECPVLRALTYDECLAIADILKLRHGRSVLRAASNGFLHGIDTAPKGSLVVALTDRTRVVVEVEVLGGPSLWRAGHGEIRHVIYGSPTHPIGADGIPLDNITETYLVNGLRDFIAANDLFHVRDKTVYAMPTGAPIPQNLLKVFRDRQVWMPMYPGHDGATTFKVRVEQLRPIARVTLPIRLRLDRFGSGPHARTLADLCSIHREREERGRKDDS